MVLHEKVLLRSGTIVETKVWSVGRGDKRYPDGLRYSLYAIHGDEILVGYDNHYPKGHHRHIAGKEGSYNFTSLENLRNDFKSDLDVELAKRGLS